MSGPLPGFLAPLTRPASWVYGRAVANRNAKFDRGEGVTRLDRPVISVGNITTGGTGKTPTVMWICQLLLRNEVEPVIAMRGHKARSGKPGDEEAEYKRQLPDVVVLANPNRTSVIQGFLTSTPKAGKADCIILDDGFQHRQIHRDLDLVLIDATRNTMKDRLLPEGHLREPLANLRRAGAVIVTRASQVDNELSKAIERFHGKPPIAWTRHRWVQLWVHCSGGLPEPEPVQWLAGKRILTMCGVGNPKSVIDQVEALGAKVAVNIPAGDHEHFDAAKLRTARGLCTGCDAMLVTMKDWMRLSPEMMRDWPVPIVVPQVEIEVIRGGRELETLVVSAVARSARVVS